MKNNSPKTKRPPSLAIDQSVAYMPPLTGKRVVELTTTVAGPAAGAMLSDFGVSDLVYGLSTEVKVPCSACLALSFPDSLGHLRTPFRVTALLTMQL